MDTIWAASPAVALLSAVIIQALKRSAWFPWISRETERANNLLAIAVATLSGIGLAVTFDWDQASGRFAAGFSGNAYDLLHVLLHAPLQWAEQQGFYKLVIALPESAGETRDLQRQLIAALKPPPPKIPPPKPADDPKTNIDIHGMLMEE